MPQTQPSRPAHRTCGAPEVHQRLLQDPEYQQRRMAIERHASRFILLGGTGLRTGVTQIPVVVHVVYSDAAGNISDAQVQSQIDVLNRDYRAKNTDSANVPAVWKGLVSDIKVQFALAKTDPAGQPATGITRTSTTVTSFGTDEGVKSSARGGIDP